MDSKIEDWNEDVEYAFRLAKRMEEFRKMCIRDRLLRAPASTPFYTNANK